MSNSVDLCLSGPTRAGAVVLHTCAGWRLQRLEATEGGGYRGYRIWIWRPSHYSKTYLAVHTALIDLGINYDYSKRLQ